MLDLFTIFSKGGVVLFSFTGPGSGIVPDEPVDSLVKDVLLQDRNGGIGGEGGKFHHGMYVMKWLLDNQYDMVFVAMYQKVLSLSYVEELLTAVHRAFLHYVDTDALCQLRSGIVSVSSVTPACFDMEFLKILSDVEGRAKAKAIAPRSMKTFEHKKTSLIASKGSKAPKHPTTTTSVAAAAAGGGDDDDDDDDDDDVACQTSTNKIDEDTTVRHNIDKIKAAAAARSKSNRKGGGGLSSSPKSTSPSSSSSKKPKIARTWDGVVSKEEARSLDMSSGKSESGNDDSEDVVTDQYLNTFRGEGNMEGDIPDWDNGIDDDDSVDYADDSHSLKEKISKPEQESRLYSFFKGLTGSKELTHEDLKSVLENTKELLVSKNVATDIAEKLCDSVAINLVGKKLGTFRTVTATVRESLEESLVRILSPKRQIDILRDVMDAREQQRPFTMVFCGVNGVGKSTNLAKTCFWLLQNKCRVLIAACDTFRSGAVEQLRVHVNCLNRLDSRAGDLKNGKDSGPSVELFDKGYGKDAADIARHAIAAARQKQFDVVLIDTAGRMQDNEPLMRALAKLIKVNQPDLCLFVGEALVGNEAVDQLSKFNRALADHSTSDKPHLIDGIILTKFDTIDDKVGAAISMTYVTGQPIVFVGTGQTYTCLKKLNVKAVVSALLK